MEDPFQYAEQDWHTQSDEEEVKDGTLKGPVPGDKKWDFSPVDLSVTVLFIILVVLTVGLVTCVIIKMLRGIGSRAKIHREIREDNFVIEPLTERKKTPAVPEPEPSAYAKRIRKSYSKLILRKTADHSRLRPMTPTELGAAAKLPESEPAQTVLSLYEKARYSADEVTKEDYRSMKDAAHVLETQPV